MRLTPILLVMLALSLEACNGLYDKIGQKRVETTLRDEHEAYEPVTKTWAGRPQMPGPGSAETAVVGPSGRLYVVAGGSSAALRYDPNAGSGQGAWQVLPQLPEPRVFAEAVATSRTVVVASGLGAQGPVPFIELFDDFDAQAAWVGVPTPFRRTDAAVVATQDRLFVIGGRDETGQPRKEVFRLAPVAASGTWTQTGSLSVARSLATGFLLGSTIHVVSGHSGSGVPLATADQIDAVTGALTATATAIPTARLGPQVVVIGDRALVYDSRTLGAVAATGRLDSFRDGEGWTRRAAHPIPLVMPAAAVLGTEMLVAGGYSGESEGQAHLYDPGVDRWTQVGSMILRRQAGFLGLVGGSARYVGGFNSEELDAEVSERDFLGF